MAKTQRKTNQSLNKPKKGKKKGLCETEIFYPFRPRISFYGTYPVFEKVSAAVSVIEAPVARSDG